MFFLHRLTTFGLVFPHDDDPNGLGCAIKARGEALSVAEDNPSSIVSIGRYRRCPRLHIYTNCHLKIPQLVTSRIVPLQSNAGEKGSLGMCHRDSGSWQFLVYYSSIGDDTLATRVAAFRDSSFGLHCSHCSYEPSLSVVDRRSRTSDPLRYRAGRFDCYGIQCVAKKRTET